MLIYAANMLYIVLYIVLLVIVIRAMFAATITIVMPDSMDAHEKSVGGPCHIMSLRQTFVPSEPGRSQTWTGGCGLIVTPSS